VYFFIMRRVPIEALGARLVRAPQYEHARGVLTDQLGRSLARIHNVDLDKTPKLLELPMAPAGASPAALEIDTYERAMHAAYDQPHPVFEYAIRWLRQRLPVVEDRVLVHGDYRLGNMMFDESGLTGVIDWELAHIGDPMEDLGWLCVKSWRFGGGKPVAGVGTREELFEAYEAAGGAKVDPERVRYWEVLGNFKWGIITLMQVSSYLNGRNRNVEHATIGRRPAETEMELLELLEGK
jgi:aminoglycoside phosphotransferase (APT) family kinase protein